LARCLKTQNASDLVERLHEIIAAAPFITGDLLTVFKRDLEFQPQKGMGRATYTAPSLGVIATITPTLSLELDDTPPLVVPERPAAIFEDAIALIRQESSVAIPLSAHVSENNAFIQGALKIPRIEGIEVDTFLHWGSYDQIAAAWQDDPVHTSLNQNTGIATIAHSIYIPTQGWHGASVFVQVRGTQEPIWLGRPGIDDAKIFISRDDSNITNEREKMLSDMRDISRDILTLSLENPHTLDTQVETITTLAPHIGPGALLAEVAPQPTEHLEKIVDVLSRTATLGRTESMFLNYGIGEIVFTTPEGPHAAAGGLAQVISGLPVELSKAGIPVSIITPVYSNENGNKHSSAHTTISRGITIGGETVKPVYLGSLTVQVGPTYYTGTTYTCRQPTAIPIKVYLAQNGNLRVFLLSNPSVFDRLYQPVFADEQLRRSVILSRATLETIGTSHFGIRPSALISNDWTTACVPALAALDPRYQSIPWLKDCKTIHMIHNGGADYHGRLPINVNNEDLWPMLGLGSDHFFGFRDPHNYRLINFTMAAVQHVSGALLTVSQPYAQQIVSPGGGDGIEHVLQHRKAAVFGISNGINRMEIDRYLSNLTGLESSALNSVDSLLTAKRTTQRAIQERYGLAADPKARIISFVGRLAEQKGLQLLSGLVEHSNRSMLEDILARHPDAQILIAGPMTEGDRTANDLRSAVEYLQWRYPGRISSHFDYVPHAKALEIIFGSTLFLMPSRFEPGGITQLEAMAAGTLVVGRNVGGISASIQNFNSESTSGNGFLFNDYTPTALANTVHWALDSISPPVTFKTLVSNARNAKHSWVDRVPAYQAMLQRIILGQERFESLSWNKDHKNALEKLTVQ
jgi:starch synthase